jgi:outer membrane murein-binding lipoprotein Lpp
MANASFVALVALLVVPSAWSVQLRQSSEARNAANPIRKVVTMLEMIKKKVEDEGAAEEKMFNKFMCYCSNSGGDLQKGIDANNVKIPETQSAIEEATALKAQLEEDLAKHRADREAAKGAIAEATSIREKEAATYAAYKAEADSNIDAIKKSCDCFGKWNGRVPPNWCCRQTAEARAGHRVNGRFRSARSHELPRCHWCFRLRTPVG